MWESLPDEYTLMDVAYIYTWKRVSKINVMIIRIIIFYNCVRKYLVLEIH
jgi:hypothetical protein